MIAAMVQAKAGEARESVMSYKDILVFVDRSGASDVRLEVAARLVERFGAHLAAVFLSGSDAPPYMSDGVMSAAIYEQVMRSVEGAIEGREREAKARFDAARQRLGVEVEWRAARGEPGEQAGLHARYADVVVIGQNGQARSGEDPLLSPEEVVFASSRPAIVVPQRYKPKTVGESVVVAWNAGKEAARAVWDALPLLKSAREVSVLAIDPKRGPAAHGQVPGADIATHLARHGVRTQVERLASDDENSADVLLRRAGELGADLLVMGAYGHSRLREFVLGGMTRSMLQRMTIPVLMSH
jgi:nucleotide-binding universal stress UspA family protein